MLGLLSRIKALCEENKVSIARLEQETGLANGSIKKWENAIPSADRLDKVAKHFKVSTDYLLYGFEKSQVLKLIDAAQFGRTVDQFAKDTGVDLEYMENLCKGDINEPPTPETIKKIMDDPDSQVLSDYIELMEAAGHYSREEAQHQRAFLGFGFVNYINKKVFAASRSDGYDKPLAPDEAAVVEAAAKAALDAYRKGKQSKKD